MGYSERSKGYKFYDPTSKSFIKIGNAKFIEKSGSNKEREVIFEEESVNIPTTIATNSMDSVQVTIPNVIQVAIPNTVINDNIPMLSPTQLEESPTQVEISHPVIMEVP